MVEYFEKKFRNLYYINISFSGVAVGKVKLPLFSGVAVGKVKLPMLHFKSILYGCDTKSIIYI